MLIFTLLFVSAGTEVFAQARSGTISGQVVDAQGSPVPNATVEVKNIATGQRLTTTSDASGNYQFDRLPLGAYELTLSGGQSTRSEQVELASEEGVQMRMRSADNGSTNQNPTVMTATATPAAQIQTAQISAAFNTRRIEYLPQTNYLDRTGRIFGAYNLGILPAGVSAAFGPVASGQGPFSNNFHFEGIDNNNRATLGPLVYIPNESTAEFTLTQNQKSGFEFGQAIGGQFNSAVRTGSNQLHGSFYDYLQNRHMNAMDPRLGPFGVDNSPRYDQNRLGASIGAPVVRDHVFFFGNFEWIPLGFSGAAGDLNTLAPTQAGYNALNSINSVSRNNLQVLNQFAGVAPQGTQTVQVAGQAIPVGPVMSSRRNWQNQYIGTGAIDFNFASSDSLHLRYAHNELDSNFNGASLAGFQSPVHTRSLLASVSHYHTFWSRLTNELRAGYTRYDNSQAPVDATYPGLASFPNVSIPADVNLNFGANTGAASNAVANTYHLADNIALTWRGHNIRLGFDGRRSISTFAGFPASSGVYAYSSLGRFLTDLPPDLQSQRAFSPAAFHPNNWSLFGYINDRFTAARGLSIDLGVGYQYLSVPSSIKAQRENSIAGVPGVIAFNEPESQMWNWTPKVGISYSPDALRKTTFRGGFGMQYDALQNSLYYLPSAPQMGSVGYGNLQSNTGGFLAGGGLLPGAGVGSGNLTAAQARAQTNVFYPDQRLPYTMQWNGGIQQQIWRGMVVEAKYLGARTLDLPVQTRLNSLARVSVQRSLPVFDIVPTFNFLQAVPITYEQLLVGDASSLQQYGFTSPITTFVNDGQSTYHALAVELRNRFAGGLQFNGSYTWSHLIDDVAYGTIQGTDTRDYDRANSVFDRRQRAVISAFWEPAALFNDPTSIVRNVVANLAVGGTFTYQSPGHATPISGFDSNLDGDGFNDRAMTHVSGTGINSASATGLTNSSGQLVGYVMNDPNARYIRTPLGSFSPSGRNTFGFGQLNNFDAFAVKRFSYRDRWAFEVRGDAYNVFNHSQFSIDPIRSIYRTSNANALTSMLIAGTNNFANLGMLSNRPRLLQVALRITF